MLVVRIKIEGLGERSKGREDLRLLLQVLHHFLQVLLLSMPKLKLHGCLWAGYG